MDTLRKFLCLGVIAAGLLVTSGCAKLEARDQLNKGTLAFKNGQFNAAIDHFQQAIQLDPSLTMAKVYLATAYQTQFIPGAPSEDNLKLAQEAVDVYKGILDTDPNNANAAAGLASLYYAMGDFDDARTYYTKSLQLMPNDPTAYYSLGAIDFQTANKPIQAARASLGIGLADPNSPIVPAKGANPEVKKVCLDLQSQYEGNLDTGVQELTKALQLKPNYDDAMSYMNLLYRLKSYLTCGNDPERLADLKTADNWVEKGLDLRRAQQAATEKRENSGVINDSVPQPNASAPSGGDGH